MNIIIDGFKEIECERVEIVGANAEVNKVKQTVNVTYPYVPIKSMKCLSMGCQEVDISKLGSVECLILLEDSKKDGNKHKTDTITYSGKRGNRLYTAWYNEARGYMFDDEDDARRMMYFIRICKKLKIPMDIDMFEEEDEGAWAD